eukprot:SAG22_NODE_3931_length_1464_cov_1.561172_1_plen_42_part_10
MSLEASDGSRMLGPAVDGPPAVNTLDMMFGAAPTPAAAAAAA